MKGVFDIKIHIDLVNLKNDRFTMILIKAIIWDLDDTFWEGTLSEEGISIIESNIELIKNLTARGIINSISSKNNFDDAKEVLIRHGVWDYFVFPKIGWYSKSGAIKDTINAMGLRPANILFIDDNHINLEETKSILTEINTLHPDSLSEIENIFDITGKPDPKHTRLQQYKIIEHKHQAKNNYDTNIDFLRSSNIKLCLDVVKDDDLARVSELVSRTNQLNFTKSRDTEHMLGDIIKSPEYDTFIATVHDNYGDYGTVGFIAINKDQHRLVHFLFSCRILNLGVEQFIYAHLSEPKLEVIGDVSAQLKTNNIPDWITLVEKGTYKTTSNEKRHKSQHICLKGGCDLTQMTIYLSKNNEIEEEVNFVTTGNTPVHPEHSYILLEKTQFKPNIPFLPKHAFETKIWDQKFDYVIYSTLMDYTQDLYQHKDGSITPFGGYSRPIQTKAISVNETEQINAFYREHTNIGPISTDNFYLNLNEILAKLPKKTKLIMLNGAEATPPSNNNPDCVQRHKDMNEVVDMFYRENTDRVILIDVRKHIKSSSDFSYDILHYKRHIYKQLSEELSSFIDQKTKSGNANLIYYIHRFKNQGIRQTMINSLVQIRFRILRLYKRMVLCRTKK